MKTISDPAVPPDAPRTVRLSRAWGYAWTGMLIAGIHILLVTIALVAMSAAGGLRDPFGTDDARIDANNLLAKGKVEQATRMPIRAGGSRMYRYEFSYNVGEQKGFTGTSFEWTSSRSYESGENIAVEYVEDDPETARIVDTSLRLFPSLLYIALLAALVVFLAVGAFYWMRASRRRSLAETGKAVAAEITGLTRHALINPTPVVLRYEFEDPWTGQRVEGAHWLAASRVKLTQQDLPAACWVAVADDLSGRSVPLSIPGWCAWESGGAGVS